MLLEFRDFNLQLVEKGEERKLFNQLNFTLEKGERVGILGPSGSGKSLLSSFIVGQEPLFSNVKSNGQILLTLNGREQQLFPQKANKKRKLFGKHIAFVPQDAHQALSPVKRVGAHMLDALLAHFKMKKTGAVERCFDELESIGLNPPEKYFTAYVHELSGGELQRLQLAIALLHQPDLIVADEPTTNLDVLAEEEVLTLLNERIEASDSALWMISHDISVLNRCCNTLYTIQDEILVPYLNGENKRPPKPELPGRFGDKPLLQLEELSFSYPNSSSGLKGASLNLHKGEIVGVAGPSGSGKSTLGRLICGILTADSGTLQKPHEKAAIQMVFQHATAVLNPGQKALEAVREISSRYQTGPAEDFLQEVAFPMDHIEKLPAQLSGGLQQRLAMARVLAAQPKLLVADEPVSALDAPLKARLLELLLRLCRERRMSMLLISHDLGLLRLYVHRILVMKEGAIYEEISPEALDKGEGKPFTRKLFNASGFTS